MRPISEATLAILKSQNLTGQNKFDYSLRLEGVDYYTDPIDFKINTLNNASGGGDFCQRADGKILFVYRNGLDIYLKVIDSEEEMMSTYNSGSGGTLFYTTGQTAGQYKDGCATLLRLKNSQILLFINDIGNFTNNIPARLIVFKSENGLGTDFVEFNIMSYYTRQNTSAGYLKGSISRGLQTINGDIYISAEADIRNYSGTDLPYLRIYKSIDNGATWVVVKTLISNYYLAYTSGLHNFIEYNGVIIFLWNYGSSSYQNYYTISFDGGNTFDNYSFVSFGAPWLFDATVDLSGNLYLLITMSAYLGRIYKYIGPSIITITEFDNVNNWVIYQDNIEIEPAYAYGYMQSTIKGTIVNLFFWNFNNIVRVTGITREEYSAPVKVTSISISKAKSGSNTAMINASNKDGALNPLNLDSPLYGILNTNKQVIIKQGYGTELIETFTGMIDDFTMGSWPQTTAIGLRDNLKKALDQTITYGTQHTIEFVNQPIENIVGMLCSLANIEIDVIEPTGISIAMDFSWCSYADAFQQLGDIASFEWGCDSYGKFYFRRDNQPDDMYLAYTFEEGIDLSTLTYKINDNDLYSKVAVFGKSGETVIAYEASFLDASKYNVFPQKILKVDATEANTVEALRKIAERSLAIMQSRTAVIDFTSIAIPWLEVGDFVGIYERSTGASSIYRLATINLNMTNDAFTMNCTAFYYGDSIVPSELPVDVETQTINPSFNLIPEMTSNIAPSGVARASSIYMAIYEPWQAFNSHSDDYYWNSITNYGWIEYQFPKKTIIDKYTIKARQQIDYNYAMPKDWIFEGFDNEKWVVLDTRTNQTAWGILEVRTFLFANTTAYSKYRLNVSRNNGYKRLQLEQLAMFYGGGS